MSDQLSFNKIAGAVLATLLAIFGLGELTNIIFQYTPPAKQGYAVAIPLEAAGGAAPVELPIDWGTELPKADINAGKEVATKCQACHNLDQGGPNMTGPNLWGVVGRAPGSHPGFAYSDGMKAFAAKQPIWDFEHINDFITGPQNYLNGTKMTFVGLKQRQDRINVIAYLHTLGSTLPIPKPNPAGQARRGFRRPGFRDQAACGGFGRAGGWSGAQERRPPQPLKATAAAK